MTTPTMMEILMDLLYQIKTKATLTVQMSSESLPFLTGTQSRNAREPSETEWVQHEEHVPAAVPQQVASEYFKNMSPMAILLIGIVIGVIVVSMRPIIIQSR
jgi:hypothetical protein